jgi:hypothetical protein
MNVPLYKYIELDFVEQNFPIHNRHVLQEIHYPIKHKIIIWFTKREIVLLLNFLDEKFYFMIFLADINFIFLIIVFITCKNIFTNQQFINMMNNKRSLIFPFNSTLKNHLTNLSLSRKRRQFNDEFKSDSLKYFTCAIVSRIFEFLQLFNNHLSDS